MRNWRRIVRAAEASGCEWFIVEQDKDFDDPFVAIEASFSYLRDQICT